MFHLSLRDTFLITLVGAALVAVGLALIYLPLAFIAVGAAVVGGAVLLVDVKKEPPK